MQSAKQEKRHFLNREHLVILGISGVSILIIIGIWAWYVARIDIIEKNLNKPDNHIEIKTEEKTVTGE